MQAKLDRARPSTTSASLYQVYFDNDVSSIKAGAVADLEQIANSLKTDPAAKKIMVIGHSDDGGTPEYNERLAEARARTVTAYLASQGLSMDKLVTQQYGSQRPVASNSSPEGRQLNRRVEILVAN
jgi:outer membrane protein OmpA-like peptidoglycan-associated protein